MGKIKQGVSLHDSFIISTGFGLKNGGLTSKRRGLPQKKHGSGLKNAWLVGTLRLTI
jgi:hypothetical protein